jgi:hypothetical protein
VIGLDTEVILDSSVVLAKAFGNFRYSFKVKKLFGDLNTKHLNYKVTPTIIYECTTRFEQVRTFVNRHFIHLYETLKKSESSSTGGSQDTPLRKSDYQKVMNYFWAASSDKSLKDTEKERLQHIETILVNRMDTEFAKPESPSIGGLLVPLLAEINTMFGNIKIELDNILSRSTNLDADQSDLEKLALEIPSLKNKNDLKILAEIKAYCDVNSNRAIWATLDYRELIANSNLIAAVTGTRCCDPLYALYNLTQ